MMGEHSRYSPNALGVNAPSSTAVSYTLDLSSLLLLGGDIESNPEPIEKENLESAFATFSERFFQVIERRPHERTFCNDDSGNAESER